MRTDYLPESQEFWEDFLMQGYGLGAFSGVPYQRGSGIGGLFKGLMRLVAPVARRALPFLKNVGLDLGKRAVEAGADIIGEVSEGRELKDSVKKSIKRKGEQAMDDIKSRLIDELQQEGEGLGDRVGLKAVKQRKLDIYDGKAARSAVSGSSKKRN